MQPSPPVCAMHVASQSRWTNEQSAERCGPCCWTKSRSQSVLGQETCCDVVAVLRSERRDHRDRSAASARRRRRITSASIEPSTKGVVPANKDRQEGVGGAWRY